jgi:dihydroorotase
VGRDADFVIVDLKAKRKITNNWIASRCGWTPYAGAETTGWPVATILRGMVAMRDGEAAPAGSGRPLGFADA